MVSSSFKTCSFPRVFSFVKIVRVNAILSYFLFFFVFFSIFIQIFSFRDILFASFFCVCANVCLLCCCAKSMQTFHFELMVCFFSPTEKDLNIYVFVRWYHCLFVSYYSVVVFSINACYCCLAIQTYWFVRKFFIFRSLLLFLIFSSFSILSFLKNRCFVAALKLKIDKCILCMCVYALA